MAMQCDEPSVTSVDDELARISGDPMRARGQHLECVFSYMDDLSRRKELRALPAIVRYLDVANPRSAEDNPIDGSVLYGGEYPAINYILWYRKASLPFLMKTIENEPSFTLKAKNAVLALMAIEAFDPPSGVKLIADELRNQNGSAKNTLSEAGRFAIDSWQCHLVRAQCRAALEVSLRPSAGEEQKDQ